MWVPFLMCLVLTGIHAYLGLHVIAREVVFVDIALAQIASLGSTAAFLWNYDLDTWGSYGFGLSFTILGALVFALTRSRERRVSQEAVIGVVYSVSAAAAVLVADRTPHGAEHLRSMLVGSILAVRGSEVVKVACLYAVIGLFHWLCRRPFLLISTNPEKAYDDGWRVRVWDFLFYASFGVVATSSGRIAGVRAPARYRLLLAILALLAAAGCQQASPPDGKPLVVASFYPLYEFARQVAGDRVQMVSLVPTGVEPHDWEPSPQDMAQVRRARLFVYNGAGLEPWAEKVKAEVDGKTTAVVSATSGVPLVG